MTEEKIAVIGLGYVGLPLALALAEKYSDVVGFDIDPSKVELLKQGVDPTGEGLTQELKATTLRFCSNSEELSASSFFIVGVPTPIDENHNPDLSALRSACDIIGQRLRSGSCIVFESTVYPGVTEDLCGVWIEAASGLKQGKDFKLGYSPERINPGDKEHTLKRVTKVVSGEDAATLERVSKVYRKIIEVGIHPACSIKVAEAAKVIENTQRDLNIALMNELAIIFDRMGIPTREVLAAAATKWNFGRFTPGLVGGHCIGVDPYYLTTKAEQLGYHPQVILAGRRINDDMGNFVARKLIKLMVHTGTQIKGARVGVLGLTFKENVNDIRNSRVPDIIAEIEDFGVTTFVHDPLVSVEQATHEYGLKLVRFEELTDLDGLVLAVPHKSLIDLGSVGITKGVKTGGVFVDVKGALSELARSDRLSYWSL